MEEARWITEEKMRKGDKGEENKMIKDIADILKARKRLMYKKEEAGWITAKITKEVKESEK